MLRDPSLIPLSHQHQHGLALCVVVDRSLASDPSAENVAKLAGRCIDIYDIELTNHFEIEEQVLFPAHPLPWIPELLADHRQLETLIVRLREAPTADLLGEFTGLLRRHIRREESELFEIVQRDLPRETLDAIGSEIERKVVRVCL